MLRVVGETMDEPKTSIEPDMWDAFWTLMWRREQKKAAKQAWSKISPNLYPEIIIAVALWRPIFLAREDTRYSPLPASWLNGERWEDEIPRELKQSRPGSHAPFKDGVASEPKGVIPLHVQVMIDRIKAGK